VFEDVIYVRVEGDNVLLRDVLGRTKTVQNARVTEVDVAREVLVLERSYTSYGALRLVPDGEALLHQHVVDLQSLLR